MNILSLFDGMSCGQIALNRVGIEYDNYYASEIDKFPIKVTQSNYPETIQIGDITQVKGNQLPKIYLMMGGSPCQGFSGAGKGLNFEDPRSKLFFEFVRLLKETNPTYFLLENVNMKQEWQDIISDFLGVKPIFINSRLVSAQDRKRVYWTNIPVVGLPEDKNIKFSDVAGKDSFCAQMRGRRINPIKLTRDDYNQDLEMRQYIECRIDEKANTLTTLPKSNVVVKERVPRKYIRDIDYRYLTPNEYEALQTVPKDYTKYVSDSQRRKMLGNGWTVDVIAFIFSFLPKNIKQT